MTTRRGIVAGGLTLTAALLLVIGLMVHAERGGRSATTGAADVRSTGESPAATLLPDSADRARLAGGVQPLVVAADVAESHAPPSTDAEEFGSLVVHVTWAADGEPAPGIPVSVTLWGDPNFEALRGRTDDTGDWSLARCPAGVVLASTDRGGRSRVAVHGGDAAHIALQVPIGVDVSGTVLDAAGSPVARAGIWVSESLTPGDVVTHADDNGRFTLRSLAQRCRFGARAAGYAPSLCVPIEASTGSLTVTLRLADGAAVRGVVLDPLGNPVGGARVQFGPLVDEPPPTVDGIRRERPPPCDRLTAADGRFEADELPADPLLCRARAPGWSPWWGSVQLPAASTTELTLRLHESASISGTARDAAGRPLAMVTISTPWYDEFGVRDANTAENGSFTLRDVPVATPFELHAVAADMARSTQAFSLSDGESRTWDPVLVPSLALPVRVIDRAGRPADQVLVRAWVAGEGRTSGGWSALAITDADGRATLRNCGDASMTVQVFTPRFAGLPLVTLRAVRASPTELLITVPDSPPVARLHGRVLDASGHAPRSLQVDILSAELGEGLQVRVDVEAGTFASQELGPGDYRIAVTSEAMSSTEISVPALAADEDRDLGVIRLAAGGP